MNLILKISLIALALTATPFGYTGEMGRLFFTPQERNQLDATYAREAKPDSDGRRSLSLSGIVQKHGGDRIIWINGIPRLAGKSDERSPESAPVNLPGQKKKIRVKVGQKVYINPTVSE